MGKRNSRKTGTEAFNEYYSELFAEEPGFFDSLAEKRAPILRFHQKNRAAIEALWKEHGLTVLPVSWHANAVLWPAEIPFGEELPGYTDGLFYPMNASSLIPVLALDAQPGDRILDACAAPGGKTLAVLDSIDGECTLTANDSSPKRRIRLKQLLQSHGYASSSAHIAGNTQTTGKTQITSSTKIPGSVQITGMDAATLFKRIPEEQHFDRILADVPCSSERHVYLDEKHVAEWSPNRIKQLAQRQIAILSGVFEALKPGGRLVYSTCTVNTRENEGVVANLLKKKKGRIRLLPWTLDCPRLPGIPAPEHTPYKSEFDLNAVCRILPHRMADSAWAHVGARQKQEAQLMDPMFVAVFERTE